MEPDLGLSRSLRRPTCQHRDLYQRCKLVCALAVSLCTSLGEQETGIDIGMVEEKGAHCRYTIVWGKGLCGLLSDRLVKNSGKLRGQGHPSLGVDQPILCANKGDREQGPRFLSDHRRGNDAPINRLHVKAERHITPGKRLTETEGQHKYRKLNNECEFCFAKSYVVDKLLVDRAEKQGELMTIEAVAILGPGGPTPTTLLKRFANAVWGHMRSFRTERPWGSVRQPGKSGIAGRKLHHVPLPSIVSQNKGQCVYESPCP